MNRELGDVDSMELPAFELDCRDWLVSTPQDGTVPEEIGGAPVVAVLSTVALGAGDFEPASAVLSVGLLDEEPAEFVDGEPVAELLDVSIVDGHARYLVPAPSGRLGLLAEFNTGCTDPELFHRFHTLMTSFRWAS